MCVERDNKFCIVEEENFCSSFSHLLSNINLSDFFQMFYNFMWSKWFCSFGRASWDVFLMNSLWLWMEKRRKKSDMRNSLENFKTLSYKILDKNNSQRVYNARCSEAALQQRRENLFWRMPFLFCCKCFRPFFSQCTKSRKEICKSLPTSRFSLFFHSRNILFA